MTSGNDNSGISTNKVGVNSLVKNKKQRDLIYIYDTSIIVPVMAAKWHSLSRGKIWWRPHVTVIDSEAILVMTHPRTFREAISDSKSKQK